MRQFIDMDSAPEPYKYINLFTKPTSAAPTPAPQPMTRGESLLALHKTGHGFPIEVLESQPTRADMTELAKAIASDRGISFDAAVNAVITEAPTLTEWED
jgi:hypothetical protein